MIIYLVDVYYLTLEDFYYKILVDFYYKILVDSYYYGGGLWWWTPNFDTSPTTYYYPSYFEKLGSRAGCLGTGSRGGRSEPDSLVHVVDSSTFSLGKEPLPSSDGGPSTLPVGLADEGDRQQAVRYQVLSSEN